MPPPEPRSSTVSPAASAARAVGLPQPRDASTACSGSTATSSSLYKLDVTGSAHVESQQAVVEQQEPGSPLPVTLRAAAAYFSRTTARKASASFIGWGAISSAPWRARPEPLGE